MTPRDHSTPWRHSTPAIARSRRNHSPLEGESPACVRRTDSQKWILRADPSNTVIARNDARFCCRGGSRTALARACPLSLSKARGQRGWNRAARFHVGNFRDVAGDLLQPHPPLGAQARQRLEQLHGAGVQYVLLDILISLKRPLTVRFETLTSFARGNGVLAVQIHDVGFPPGQPIREQASKLADPVRSATQS